jgi:SAM-dependent methyltransferase
MGCSKGKDIMKMYHARIKEYVGTDPDYDGLFGALDSAKARYLSNLKKFPDFIKSVNFILADNRVLLDSKLQKKKILNMTIENEKLIDKIFSDTKKFDIINCNFAIHYLFDTENSIDALVQTIKTFLIKDGYFTCTVVDPNQLMKILNNKNIYTSMYTDDEGSRQKFFEIIKKFEGNYTDIPGQAVDYYMAWIHNEGTYATEYIVSPKYLINIMKLAGCELIDTDLFVNIYNINKDWFLKVIDHEENPKNKEFYKKVAKFYGELKGSDKESLIWNELWRYYIFKKK